MVLRPFTNPLLVCLCLLIFYQILVGSLMRGGFLTVNNGINGKQSNRIRAERYIYDWKVTNDVVMLGSSMIAR
ncbi:MAG: hypothetical protein SAK42_01510, partial [Oscillatoria sp. PMC 1076.18]|nr:hypothetical protein [Oscillatoria sp. PMC 1076.18]